MRKESVYTMLALIACIAIPIGGIVWAIQGYQTFKVYSARMAGEAKLAEAESERQIQIADAKGRMEAAHMLASAEVERAKGVAEANKIIGESLNGNDAYLRYLWIERLGQNGQDVIYIPTEAGLPILEAGRRAK